MSDKHTTPSNLCKLEQKVQELKACNEYLRQKLRKLDDRIRHQTRRAGTLAGGGGTVSREQLPYMSDEQFHKVAFVYRSKDKKLKAVDKTRVVGFLYAKVYENNPDWEHLATLDSFRWIECLLNNSQRERNKQIKEITQ